MELALNCMEQKNKGKAVLWFQEGNEGYRNKLSFQFVNHLIYLIYLFLEIVGVG